MLRDKPIEKGLQSFTMKAYYYSSGGSLLEHIILQKQ
jgi:hypothetical protein